MLFISHPCEIGPERGWVGLSCLGQGRRLARLARPAEQYSVFYHSRSQSPSELPVSIIPT